MGRVATKPSPPRGSRKLSSEGAKQRWPKRGPGDYMALAAWGVPNASERGIESKVAYNWAAWLHNPPHWGGTQRLKAVKKKTPSGPQVGQVAT